jgi:hypothetical protein
MPYPHQLLVAPFTTMVPPTTMVSSLSGYSSGMRLPPNLSIDTSMLVVTKILLGLLSRVSLKKNKLYTQFMLLPIIKTSRS